jgi:hypothetical protein
MDTLSKSHDKLVSIKNKIFDIYDIINFQELLPVTTKYKSLDELMNILNKLKLPMEIDDKESNMDFYKLTIGDTNINSEIINQTMRSVSQKNIDNLQINIAPDAFDKINYEKILSKIDDQVAYIKKLIDSVGKKNNGMNEIIENINNFIDEDFDVIKLMIKTTESAPTKSTNPANKIKENISMLRKNRDTLVTTKMSLSSKDNLELIVKLKEYLKQATEFLSYIESIGISGYEFETPDNIDNFEKILEGVNNIFTSNDKIQDIYGFLQRLIPTSRGYNHEIIDSHRTYNSRNKEIIDKYMSDIVSKSAGLASSVSLNPVARYELAMREKEVTDHGELIDNKIYNFVKANPGRIKGDYILSIKIGIKEISIYGEILRKNFAGFVEKYMGQIKELYEIGAEYKDIVSSNKIKVMDYINGLNNKIKDKAGFESIISRINQFDKYGVRLETAIEDLNSGIAKIDEEIALMSKESKEIAESSGDSEKELFSAKIDVLLSLKSGIQEMFDELDNLGKQTNNVLGKINKVEVFDGNKIIDEWYKKVGGANVPIDKLMGGISSINTIHIQLQNALFNLVETTELFKQNVVMFYYLYDMYCRKNLLIYLYYCYRESVINEASDGRFMYPETLNNNDVIKYFKYFNDFYNGKIIDSTKLMFKKFVFDNHMIILERSFKLFTKINNVFLKNPTHVINVRQNIYFKDIVLALHLYITLSSIINI